MDVLPVLLLLMQLTATVLGQTNVTANANANATAIESPTTSKAITPQITQNNKNGTALDADTAKQPQGSKDKVAEVINPEEHFPVLARGVTNTDTATVRAVTVVNATTPTQAPPVTKSTAAAIVPKQESPTSKPDRMVAPGVLLSDINIHNVSKDSSNSSSSNNNNNSNDKNSTPSVATSNGSAINSNTTVTSNNSSIAPSINSSTSTTTTTASTTTTIKTTPSTTTSSTTMRPKKPTVTYSMDKQLDGEKLDATSTISGSVAPHVLPVQEMSNLTDRGENEYIVPIVTIMLAVPLAIAVFIVVYRRFRDLWTTRHYRRMDFLVDGMYND